MTTILNLGPDGMANFKKFLQENDLTVSMLARRVADITDSSKQSVIQGIYQWKKRSPLKLRVETFEKVLMGTDYCIHSYPYMPEREKGRFGTCECKLCGGWYIYFYNKRQGITYQRMILKKIKGEIICSLPLASKNNKMRGTWTRSRENIFSVHVMDKEQTQLFAGFAYNPIKIGDLDVIMGLNHLIVWKNAATLVWVAVKHDKPDPEAGRMALEHSETFIEIENHYGLSLKNPHSNECAPKNFFLFGGGLL